MRAQGTRTGQVLKVQVQLVLEQIAGSTWPKLGPASPEPAELGWLRQWSQQLQEMQETLGQTRPG